MTTCTRRTHKTTLAAHQAANAEGGEAYKCRRCGWWHVRPRRDGEKR